MSKPHRKKRTVQMPPSPANHRRKMMHLLRCGGTRVVRWIAGIILTPLVASLVFPYVFPDFKPATQQPLNLGDPFSAPFEVTYENAVPAAAVETFCSADRVDWANGSSVRNVRLGEMVSFGWTWKGDTVSMLCDRGPNLGMPVTMARVWIAVRFRPFPYGFSRVKRWRYVAVRQSDGNWRWVRQDTLGVISQTEGRNSRVGFWHAKWCAARRSDKWRKPVGVGIEIG